MKTIYEEVCAGWIDFFYKESVYCEQKYLTADTHCIIKDYLKVSFLKLLDKQIELVEKMKKEYHKEYTCICDYGEPCENCLYGYYNQALSYQITSLKEQKKLIEN